MMKKLPLILLLTSIVASASTICVGEQVVANLSSGHFDARVIEVYSDGTALIRFDVDGTSRTVALSELSEPINEESGFQLNEQVVANLSSGHFDARILELYSDHTALIRFNIDGTSRNVAISELSHQIDSERTFSKGEPVVANLSSGHFDARILELYSDDTALIRFNIDGTSRNVAISELSHPIDHEGGFGVNDEVVANLSSGHFDARILELYSDHTALIRFNIDGTSRNVAISELSHPIVCEGGCRR